MTAEQALREILTRLDELFAKIDRRPYYTITDLRELLRTSKPRIAEWIKTGELRAFNVGTRRGNPQWRVSPADLDRWKAGRQALPRGTPGPKPR